MKHVHEPPERVLSNESNDVAITGIEKGDGKDSGVGRFSCPFYPGCGLGDGREGTGYASLGLKDLEQGKR